MALSKRTLEFLKRNRPWVTKEEIPITSAAVLFFIISGFFVSITNALLDDLNPFVKNPTDTPAHDLLLNLLHAPFKSYKVSEKIPDHLMNWATGISLLRVALGCNHACLLLRRICWLMGIGYFIRIPFTLMTMLPNPNPNCNFNREGESFVVYVFLLAAQKKESCGDVIFSGHTIPFISTALIWLLNPVPYFTRRTNIACKILVSTFSLCSILSLIAARYHYTVDCVISAATMILLWKLYYFSLSQPNKDYWLYSFVHYIDAKPTISDTILPISEDTFQT